MQLEMVKLNWVQMKFCIIIYATKSKINIFNSMAHTGNENIVRLLIENGANINTLNMYNNVTLILAIANGI